MAESEKSGPAKPGKLVVFRGEAAPTLDETGMMDPTVWLEPGAAEAPVDGALVQRYVEAARLTVPFRQEGADGFSLVTVEFAPGYALPRHSHSSDCLYYIVDGEIRMGQRVLGAGDGFFLPAEQPYTYTAGPQGVRLLEFRHRTSFDIKIWEKDGARFWERVEASLDAPGAGETRD